MMFIFLRREKKGKYIQGRFDKHFNIDLSIWLFADISLDPEKHKNFNDNNTFKSVIFSLTNVILWLMRDYKVDRNLVFKFKGIVVGCTLQTLLGE